MALTFMKKTAGGVAAANTANGSAEGETMTKPAGASWIKRGAAAKTAYAQEEAKAELRKQEAGKLWDFWMPEDSERQITFLDGKLDEDGMLECGMFHQHNIRSTARGNASSAPSIRTRRSRARSARAATVRRWWA